MSLFSYEELNKSRKEGSVNPDAVTVSNKNEHRTNESLKKLKDIVRVPKMGETIHIICCVNWSMHDLLAYLLGFTGAADVCLTSWAISENPARTILKLIDKELIKNLHCIFDSRIKSQCPQAWQIIERNFKNVFLTDIHAKMLTITNKDWAISVTGTANLTNKRRIEKYVICCDRRITEADNNWIMKTMYSK